MNCKLKEILEDKMIKQSALAARVGITETTMSKIVRGKSEPTLRVAIQIAKALNVNVEDIWTEENPTK